MKKKKLHRRSKLDKEKNKEYSIYKTLHGAYDIQHKYNNNKYIS